MTQTDNLGFGGDLRRQGNKDVLCVIFPEPCLSESYCI